jgi:hypothetical protein
MSKIEVKELTTLSGETELTLGESGKTIAVPSGTTLDIKSGATIANNGTATGFGGGQVDSVVAGTNVTVDNTDPVNPIVNSTGGASGSIIQVKSYTAAISFSGTGNTSLSVSITPSSTANKIFILATLSKTSSSTTGDGSPAFYGFKRNGTDLGWYAMMYKDGGRDAGHSLSYFDAPSSTSAVTYLVHASAGLILNNSNSTITVMEIKA